jgi:biopolymer transport protein ExbB
MDLIYYYLPALETVRDFLEMGGGVLYVIGMLTMFMWTLIIERLVYLRSGHKRLERNIPMIQTCVALCPLLGLLGTVTGMIEVFEVMAISGSSSPRSMAAGVSKATIPTMAGMVAALSGVAMGTYLKRKVSRERALLADHLVIEHE